MTSGQGVPRTNTSIPSMKYAFTAWRESLRKIQPSGDVDQDFAALMKAAKDPKLAAGLEGRLKKLEEQATAAEKDEAKIVDEVNVYCTGSK